MKLEITQKEYCRFGGLKRFLLEKGFDASDEAAVKNLQLEKKAFSEEASFFADEELKALKGQSSFWTEYDWNAHGINEKEFNFQAPVEKYSCIFYSHYAVVREWFKVAEKIKKQLKENGTAAGEKSAAEGGKEAKTKAECKNRKLFENPVEIEESTYFNLVRKICGTQNFFVPETADDQKKNQIKSFFLYKILPELKHPVLLRISSSGVEVHIPFYGFYSFFKTNELQFLEDFLSFFFSYFQSLLSRIEENHNSYIEEKYGEEFLKIKKHEMQYELKKQLEESLKTKFSGVVHEISPEAGCECQPFENLLRFMIFSKKQHFTFNFTYEELNHMLEKNLESLKEELRKIIL